MVFGMFLNVLIEDECGIFVVEFGLICVLIVFVMFSVFQGFVGEIIGMWMWIYIELDKVINGGG